MKTLPGITCLEYCTKGIGVQTRNPIIQSPGYSQSCNGYSYCLNNPFQINPKSNYYFIPDPWDNYYSHQKAQGGGDGTFNNIISTATQIGDWAIIGLYGPQIATDPKLNIKSRYQPRNYKPAVEAQVAKGMKTAYKYMDYAGKALGVVSAVDHYNKAYQNYQNDNVWAAIGYGALGTLDVALMFVETTNPFILAGILVYNVVDATAF